MSTIKIFDTRISLRELVFTVTGLFCVSPWVSPPAALTLGLFIALFVGHPFLHVNHRAVRMLLQYSVIGLGFGMDAGSALKAGKDGLLFAVASITGTLTIGWLLGKILKIDRKTSLLISGGTAICGGSAIAALSPVIGADERQVSVAMGTVFILNSAALFLFPIAGQWLHLSQAQFGLWAAIAIHDTSSVVGAAGKYGPEALQIATTVKLARALWIIPVSLMAAFFYRSGPSKVQAPWFIGVFVLVVMLHTWMPMPFFSHVVVKASHAGMTLTLFLIGCGLSRQVLMNTGVKPLVQGIVVWILIAVAALWAVIALA